MADIPRIMFYHDGRHPLIYMYEPPMQREEYEQAVDELAGTPVEALMFCLGDGRTVLHDTEVGELWGHNMERWSHEIFRRAHQNARALIDAGNDPLRIVSERARQKGIAFYPTLLVQQGRGGRESDTRCSDFRFDNTHLEIGAKPGAEELPYATCLDFMHEEVREERFALIEETLRKYDVDGFELQMNYTPHYFHPDEVEEGKPVLNAWIRRVYEEVKASGSERHLVIRIPASIEGCGSVGMDVKAWIDEGVCDALVAQTFSGPELINSNADYTELVEAARGSGCKVIGAIQSHVDSDRLGEGPVSMTRACATNYWDQGVDGLYLAHWFNLWPYGADFYERLRELPHPDIMSPRDKFYFAPTMTGRYPEPQLEPGVEMELPKELQEGETAAVHLRVSDDLPRWAAVGRVHEVILRIRLMSTTELDKVSFHLNGERLPESGLRRINEMYRMSRPRYRAGSAYWFVFRLPEEHWPVQGINLVEVKLHERDGALTMPLRVRDVELETRYLMGRNYHRSFVDDDLGPYEHASD
ncbi:MAG: hypothetical protein OXH50_07065 [Gemmatimonadetes bacterium]|nr:hypothetical protein [Gemmatimonadota bacterium]